jgi:hypothetical protein
MCYFYILILSCIWFTTLVKAEEEAHQSQEDHAKVFMQFSEPNIKNGFEGSKNIVRFVVREQGKACIVCFDLDSMKWQKRSVVKPDSEEINKNLNVVNSLSKDDLKLILAVANYSRLKSIPANDRYTTALDGADIVIECLLAGEYFSFHRSTPFSVLKEMKVNKINNVDPYVTEKKSGLLAEDERLNNFILILLVKGQAEDLFDKLN